MEIGVKQPPAILLMFLATPLLPFCWSFRTSTTLTLSFCLVPYWLERFHRHIAEDLTESSLEFASTKAIFFHLILESLTCCFQENCSFLDRIVLILLGQKFTAHNSEVLEEKGHLVFEVEGVLIWPPFLMIYLHVLN